MRGKLTRILGASLVAVAIFVAHSEGAGAPPQLCSPYLGQRITVKSFDEVSAIYSKIPPKDEFETTEQYRRKTEAITSNNAGVFIVSKKIEDLKYVPYDADRGALMVQAFAFNNIGFDVQGALYYAKLPTGINNIYVVISEEDKRVGTYTGQNSFGAKTQITKTTRTTKAIFQSSAEYYPVKRVYKIGDHDVTGIDHKLETLFLNIDKDYVLGKIQLPPDKAKNLRNNLRIAFVIKPKPPFLVKSNYPFGETTMLNPEEIRIAATVLIADIHCGLLMDETNTLIGAYDALGLKNKKTAGQNFQ